MDGLVTAGILLSFAAIMAGIAGLIMLTIRGARRRGLYAFGAGVAVFVLSITMVAIGNAPDDDAKKLGFADAADRTEATAAGITDAKLWTDLKSKREQEEATRIATEKAARDEKIAAYERAQEEKCRNEIQCIGDKKHIEATFACRKFVENLAENDYQWVDGWSESKFSHLRFKNLKHDTITYSGDKIQFQNGIGNWIRHTYECDYNIDDKSVVDVRARQGRLPS